jgi:hypothetical protein
LAAEEDEDGDTDDDESATATLPATVRESSRVVDWKRAPHRSRGGTAGSQAHASKWIPRARSCPALERPLTKVASVDLPHPDGPASRTHDPGSRVNSTLPLAKGHAAMSARVTLKWRRGGILSSGNLSSSLAGLTEQTALYCRSRPCETTMLGFRMSNLINRSVNVMRTEEEGPRG